MENFGLVISLSVCLLTFYLGQLQGAKNEGKKQGILLNELENIKQDLRELKKDFKQINVEKIHSELSFLKNELANCKDSINSTNRRIDNQFKN